MATTKRMKIEGKPVRPYSLYRIDLNDEIIELVVLAETRLKELKAHMRPDWKYAFYQNRKEDRLASVPGDRLNNHKPIQSEFDGISKAS